MVNDLVQGTAGTAILYSCMLVYLALGMTTTQYALRQSLDLIIVGEGAQFTWRRHVSAASSQDSRGADACTSSWGVPRGPGLDATTGMVCVLFGGVLLHGNTSPKPASAQLYLF